MDEKTNFVLSCRCRTPRDVEARVEQQVSGVYRPEPGDPHRSTSVPASRDAPTSTHASALTPAHAPTLPLPSGASNAAWTCGKSENLVSLKYFLGFITHFFLQI